MGLDVEGGVVLDAMCSSLSVSWIGATDIEDEMDFEGWGTRQHTGTTRRRMETLMGGGYLEIEISARSEDRLTYVRGRGRRREKHEPSRGRPARLVTDPAR